MLVFVRLRAGDARSNEEVVAQQLRLTQVQGAPADKAGRWTKATATLDGHVPVTLTSARSSTAKGTVVVSAVAKRAASPGAQQTLTRIAGSVRVAEPATTAPADVPRDLAGRPRAKPAAGSRPTTDTNEEPSR